MNVFITGASSGIGAALASAYASQYKNKVLNIGLVARRSEHLQTLKVLLETQPNTFVQPVQPACLA